MSKKKNAENSKKLLSSLTLIIILGAWYVSTDLLELVSPKMLPSPTTVINTFAYKIKGGTVPDGSSLATHIMSSLKIALGGFCAGSIIGVPMGIGMAWNDKLNKFVKPLFDLLRPIPALAWIPLMILWLGIGYSSKVGIVFFASVIAATLNSYAGIMRTKDVHIWVAQTFGASRRQLLFKVAIPTAMPMIFTGLRLALGSSWVALVAAELVAATSGLGYMIQMGRMVGRTDIIFVGMITIGLIGLLLSKGLETLQKKYVKGDI